MSIAAAEELLLNIKRSCIRARNYTPPVSGNSAFLATCDHIEDLADQALSQLASVAKETIRANMVAWSNGYLAGSKTTD